MGSPTLPPPPTTFIGQHFPAVYCGFYDISQVTIQSLTILAFRRHFGLTETHVLDVMRWITVGNRNECVLERVKSQQLGIAQTSLFFNCLRLFPNDLHQI